jgi:signal peptidase I
MKKILSSIIILLSLVWLFLFRPVFLGGPASYIIVSGISMQPTLFTGDLTIMQRQTSYSVGEIVAFRVTGGIVIHRIVGGSAEEGFITQGDNKEASDPWNPKPDKILGKMWFRIPKAGKLLGNLRKPGGILAAAGLIAFLILDEPDKAHRKNSKRKRMKKAINKFVFGLNNSSVMNLLGGSGFFALLFLAAAIYSFLQPLEKPTEVERVRYTHTSQTRYTIHTQPSVLYPDNILGPFEPDPSKPADTPATTTILTSLARSLDLEYRYSLETASPAEVLGTLDFELQVKAGDAWTKTSPIGSTISFSGPAVSSQAAVDFAEIQALIQTVEKETGYQPGSYEIVLVPTVSVSGDAGGYPINETVSQPFTMLYNRTTIKMDNVLKTQNTKTVQETIQQPNVIRVSRLSIPVKLARLASLLGGIFCLSITGLLSAGVFFGVGLDEPASFQARYGNMIVSVASADLNKGRKVQVAAFRDLVRLAQRDGQMILHKGFEYDSHLYFVPDGETVYIYPVKGSKEEG